MIVAGATPLSIAGAGKLIPLPSTARIRNPNPIRYRSLFAARSSTAPPAATISVGDRLPDSALSYIDPSDDMVSVKISDLTSGKKVILFAVTGAFTPTCSRNHLPGFLDRTLEFRRQGVDTVACISVNDAFVMRAWGNVLGVPDHFLLLSDGNGDFTRALGVQIDLSDKPALLGVRSRRYALLAEDGIVTALKLEEGSSFSGSSADEILRAMSA